jgi:hypothetical protein
MPHQRPKRQPLRGLGSEREREAGMKHVIEMRFTDPLGFTYERYMKIDGDLTKSGGSIQKGEDMFIVYVDGKRDTFEIIDSYRFALASDQYKKEFLKRKRGD